MERTQNPSKNIDVNHSYSHHQDQHFAAGLNFPAAASTCGNSPTFLHKALTKHLAFQRDDVRAMLDVSGARENGVAGWTAGRI